LSQLQNLLSYSISSNYFHITALTPPLKALQLYIHMKTLILASLLLTALLTSTSAAPVVLREASPAPARQFDFAKCLFHKICDWDWNWHNGGDERGDKEDDTGIAPSVQDGKAEEGGGREEGERLPVILPESERLDDPKLALEKSAGAGLLGWRSLTTKAISC
jgi:hypothetical protein